jgi:hypothetical protein
MRYTQCLCGSTPPCFISACLWCLCGSTRRAACTTHSSSRGAAGWGVKRGPACAWVWDGARGRRAAARETWPARCAAVRLSSIPTPRADPCLVDDGPVIILEGRVDVVKEHSLPECVVERIISRSPSLERDQLHDARIPSKMGPGIRLRDGRARGLSFRSASSQTGGSGVSNPFAAFR